MKKSIIAILMLILSLSIFADDYSIIKGYKEEIYPEGYDARIEIVIDGKTNDNGVLFLPYEDDLLVDKIEVTKGNLINEEVVRVEVGSLVFKGITFAEKNEEVSLKVTVKKEGFYTGGKSKQKGSHPNGLKTVKFALLNNTPSKIEDYSVKIFIPEGIELHNMLVPSKTADFDLGIENELKYVFVEKSSIKSQSTFKVEFNTLKRDPKAKLVVYLLTIGFSLFFMWKRKDQWR